MLLPPRSVWGDYACPRTDCKGFAFPEDGQDLYFISNDSFFPRNGNINIPSGTARDIPELAYSFPPNHKNGYRIQANNNPQRNRYIITVQCDFDADNDGRDDRYTATTDIRRGEVQLNRVVVQTH
jgi:hypothetical protein